MSLGNVVDKVRGAGFSAAYWRELGMRLTPMPDLDAIAADHRRASVCLEKVIDHWMRNGENVSWETLADAVTRCRDGGGQNVGNKLRRSVGIGW